MKEKCLLVKTKDDRNFLTHKDNLQSLVEFAKTFGAEIYMVEPSPNSKILELKPLISALCNSQNKDNPEFDKPERLYPQSKRDRQTILEDAKLIRQFIHKRLISGQSVSLKELKDKYKEHDLSDACLCNHMAVIRKSLSKEGYNFRKVGAGKYCLSN